MEFAEIMEIILMLVKEYWLSLVLSIVSLILCTKIAIRKGRSGVRWFFAGAFFGIIALVIILLLPRKED